MVYYSHQGVRYLVSNKTDPGDTEVEGEIQVHGIERYMYLVSNKTDPGDTEVEGEIQVYIV